MRLGIAAIFRNEFPYILEWLAHHRVLGVDAFFIADNGSDDGTTELLTTLDQLGYITHLPFPTRDGVPPQLPAYTTLMQQYAHRVDWMAFIDADEFLLPTSSQSIKQTLRDASVLPGAGAVAVNWAVYGSAGHLKQPSGLVIENFQQRAEKALVNNHHIKSIVRCQAYASVDGNPHIFKLADGWRYVHTDGRPLEHHTERGRGLSQTICWEHLRLNHYVIKSREEFERRKSPKGSATRLDRTKGEGYFQHHDRNEVTEPVDFALVSAVQAEVSRIQRALADHGTTPVERASTAIIRPPLFKGIRGHVDKLEWADSTLSLKGWALCGNGEFPSGIQLIVDNEPVANLSLSRFPRPDVQRHYPSATLASGFHIKASVQSASAHNPRVQVLASETENGSSTALAMP